jgi:translation elongation factor EF-Tu-like GTPase
MARRNPVHFDIQDVFQIHGRGVVLTGKMVSGVIRVGQQLVLSGSGRALPVTVLNIEVLNKKDLHEAITFPPDYKGDTSYGLLLGGLDRKDQVLKGDVLTKSGGGVH